MGSVNTIAVYVSDFDTAVKFYAEIPGIEVAAESMFLAVSQIWNMKGGWLMIQRKEKMGKRPGLLKSDTTVTAMPACSNGSASRHIGFAGIAMCITIMVMLIAGCNSRIVEDGEIHAINDRYEPAAVVRSAAITDRPNSLVAINMILDENNDVYLEIEMMDDRSTGQAEGVWSQEANTVIVHFSDDCSMGLDGLFGEYPGSSFVNELVLQDGNIVSMPAGVEHVYIYGVACDMQWQWQYSPIER
ncbi:MAG: hypothetical protein KAR40_17480 [Candidatus Sabulitectum sp.]|nr:hypothetical protein [Candidatus Sabulitectum sp.]